MSLSPRVWGWTEDLHQRRDDSVVVPTRVGMDRTTRSRARRRSSLSPRVWGWTGQGPRGAAVGRGCPHACGDGPGMARHDCLNWMLSPRVWGWTGDFRRISVSAVSCPHACGDGPWCARGSVPALRCPHACGDGPSVLEIVRPENRVVPTRVGMDRIRESELFGPRQLSPRVWGWTGDDTRRRA